MQIDDLENQVKKLKLEKTHLLSKIDDLENRGRRNNLIFHGYTRTSSGFSLAGGRSFRSTGSVAEF